MIPTDRGIGTSPWATACSGDPVPARMRRYRTGRTPWPIIIDRNGVVRFDGFRISAERAVARIESLRVGDATR